jgi:hypothetical protein
MAAKKRRAMDEDEILPVNPEDADVDVLMASPEHHHHHHLLLQDGDELLASNAAQAVGMDEASKRPLHIPPSMPPPAVEESAQSVPKKKKNEWIRKAGDLQLPMQRTRRILKSDKDIKMVNLAAVVVISKATVRLPPRRRLRHSFFLLRRCSSIRSFMRRTSAPPPTSGKPCNTRM